MKISILLPYKENFSPNYAGAVSLFLRDTIKLSKYKKNIIVFGNTTFKKKLLTNYKNIKFSKFFFKSSTKSYLRKFLQYESLKKSDLIEIHNRPEYINAVFKINRNIVFYFHNNPLDMKSSYKLNDRLNIIKKTKKIIFNSNWTLNQFKKGISKKEYKDKLEIIHQSTDKKKINFNKKEKIVIFVGRLNKSKGYDIFGKAIIKILDKYPNWKTIIIGDEPREKILFKHKNLKLLGFQNYSSVTKWFTKSSIAVVCPKKEEPFGRTALEASSCGCAVIISNKGGLPEASPKAIKINSLTVKNLEFEITKLIKNDNLLLKLQKKIFNDFKLTNKKISKKIDLYRNKII
jgi:glycosyltransferase involved in cell wall biosynthesis